MRFLRALAVLLAPFAAPSQQSSGELRLSVRDASGSPMQVSGRLESLASGSSRAFQTNAQGASVVTSLPFGRYRLEVFQRGFATQSEVLDIRSQEPVSRTITMSVGAQAFSLDIVATTPLAGVDRVLEEIPGPVQNASHDAIEASGALDLSDFMNRRLNGVFLNHVQGNPLQPDVNYRGYTASPLLGTPQGLSVYMDGVRLNQPFGDVVSWDLIPRIAIAEVTLIPGSNPLFGLNALGGALSLRTKDGYTQPGTTLQLSGGSFGRKMADFEHGGSTARGVNWYLASSLFFEDGWREASPSNVRQFLGKLGWQRERTTLGLTLAYVNNSLIGNGLQEERLLARDYASLYTRPDVTANRAPFVNLSARHSLTPRVTFAGNAYFRYIRTKTLNGDINEESLDQSMYQPSAAERAALLAAGYTDVPAGGATAANTPFPFLRCIGNVLLNDEPSEKCNGLLNRSRSDQRNYGVSGQMSWSGSPGGHRNQFTMGAGYDGNSVGFLQSTELGYLLPDRGVAGLGAFGDGVTGGEADGEPFDTRVNLSGRIHTGSIYVTDTITLGNAWNVTLSGRYSHTSIHNLDRIRPAAGSGSLTGDHGFDRLNPAAGLTYRIHNSMNVYFGYTEGNRAPTSIELGCADPASPCKLPNAMAGDPPLKQVVARTFEGGIRGGAEGAVRWSAGWFRSDNRNDILFVASEQTGFGYFRNFGKTLRQGLEVDLRARMRRLNLGGGYTFLDATFRSPESVNGTGNSSNEDALEGLPGMESSIAIRPGDRIPLTPRNMLKSYAELEVTSKLLVDLNLIAISSSYGRGNENNRHKADGVYYLGSGVSPGYAVVNLAARYQVRRHVRLFGQVNNLFDRRYYTAAQLGPTGFTESGAYIARPFAAIDGEFPVRQATFYAPGAPRGAWGGISLQF